MGFAPKLRKRFDVLCVLYLRRILTALIAEIVALTYCKFAVIVVAISACAVVLTDGVIPILTMRNIAVVRRTTTRKLVALITATITVLGVARVRQAVVRAVVATDKKKTAKVFSPSKFFPFEKGKMGYTKRVERLKRLYLFLKRKYEILSLKKYTTLAGTLVFFLITSIVPLTFWITLLIGKLPINAEQVFRLSVFSSVRGVLDYIRQEASNATTGASVVLIFTTLYSSTNLFYQMRKSGEIIYDYRRPKHGLKLRLGALALLFIVVLLILAFVVTFALGTILFSRFLPAILERIADYTLLVALAFALALLLNAYICPYKAPLKKFVLGALLTVGAWAVAVTGFAIYLKISNMDKLYGALSALIVFFLWLYALMICFIAGVIFNSERVIRSKRKGKKTVARA